MRGLDRIAFCSLADQSESHDRGVTILVDPNVFGAIVSLVLFGVRGCLLPHVGEDIRFTAPLPNELV